MPIAFVFHTNRQSEEIILFIALFSFLQGKLQLQIFKLALSSAKLRDLMWVLFPADMQL